MSKKFTPFYEYLAEWNEIDLPEALVLSRVQMWGNSGCYESYATLAQRLKLDRRTVIRAVKRLLKKELLVVMYHAKYKRILYSNVEKISNMPLFQGKKVVSQRHHLHKSSVTETPGSVRESPKVVSESHPSISSIHRRNIQNNINSLSEVMTTHEAKPLSPAEQQKRKVKMLADLGLSKKQ